jgi:hypothetical protein
MASSSHANDKRSDVWLRAWSSNSALLRPVILGGDQTPVPSQQRVRRNDGTESSECRPPDCLGLLCEPSTLRVGPANALVAKLLAVSLILRLEVFDHGLLVSIHPAGEDQKEELKV